MKSTAMPLARNECTSRLRDRMRRPLVAADEEDESTAAPDALAEAIANADLHALSRSIRELPAQQREALLLREFSGLSYEELSATLGASEPTVRSLLFRARRGVKAAMAAQLDKITS